MGKEILLYNPIYSYTAASFIEDMTAAKGEDVTLRMNCDGGSPEDCYGMIAKWKEYKGAKKIKVDGKAKSMGLYFLCYADKGSRECLDVSSFLAHRAAYPSWIESDANLFTDARKQALNDINGQLRAAFEASIDVAMFEKIAGRSMDEIFSLDSRFDISLTAAQAKQIGLIDKINTITPSKRDEIMQAIDAGQIGIAAQFNNPQPKLKPSIPNIMTAQELQASHPDVYAAIKAEGMNQERIRVNTWLKHIDTDSKLVAESIAAGALLTDDVREDLIIKRFSKATVTAMEDSNTPPVGNTPTTTSATAEEAKMQADVDAILKMI